MYSNYLFTYVFIYLFIFIYLLIYLFDLRIIFWVGKFQLAFEFQQHSRGGRSEVCGLNSRERCNSYDPNEIYIYMTPCRKQCTNSLGTCGNGDVFPDQLTEPGRGVVWFPAPKQAIHLACFGGSRKKGLSLGNFIHLFRGSDVDLWGSARWSFFTWWLPEKNNINTDFHWRRGLNGRYTSKLKLHHAYIIGSPKRMAEALWPYV